MLLLCRGFLGWGGEDAEEWWGGIKNDWRDDTIVGLKVRGGYRLCGPLDCGLNRGRG